jgi:hypothetical protein
MDQSDAGTGESSVNLLAFGFWLLAKAGWPTLTALFAGSGENPGPSTQLLKVPHFSALLRGVGGRQYHSASHGYRVIREM